MIFLVLVIFIIVLVISACIAGERLGFAGWLGCFIFACILSIGLYYWHYQSTRIDVERLYAEQNNIIMNYKTLTLNLNKIATVNIGDSILIDIANLRQSTNTSEVFKEWVTHANQYNLKLASEKAKREIDGFFGKLWYGWRVSLKPELKYIEIKI